MIGAALKHGHFDRPGTDLRLTLAALGTKLCARL